MSEAVCPFLLPCWGIGRNTFPNIRCDCVQTQTRVRLTFDRSVCFTRPLGVLHSSVRCAPTSAECASLACNRFELGRLTDQSSNPETQAYLPSSWRAPCRRRRSERKGEENKGKRGCGKSGLRQGDFNITLASRKRAREGRETGVLVAPASPGERCDHSRKASLLQRRSKRRRGSQA